MASGHQVSESRRNHRPYLQERSRKLAVQKETTNAAEQPQILSNVKVYIDGLLSGTTDIEMKRVVSRAGGQILYVTWKLVLICVRQTTILLDIQPLALPTS